MSSIARPRLIVMLKYPEAGRVKTRLVPALGERRACELYRAMVRHTLDEVRQFATQESVRVEARVAGAPDSAAVLEWIGAEIPFSSQGDGDLGQRIESAIQQAFGEGAPAVLVIGADCPKLKAEHLRGALRGLESRDVVLGPAADGGYYLIGMRKFLPELLRGIEWSTERVLEQTLAAVRHARVEFQLLETLHDVDQPEDLRFWTNSDAAKAMGAGKVSVVIPALNEAANLRPTLEATQRGHPYEVILVDGGSTDETRAIARSLDCIVLSGPRCRAQQMNTGAAIATGEYLLFLHADTLLPSGYAAHISKTLAETNTVAGAFRFTIAEDFFGRKLVESTTNWRARTRQLPYGDQGLFLRRDIFTRMGGFPELPIMEDYEFVRRLRRLGRIEIARAPASTSGRRWKKFGVVRTTLMNQVMIVAYHLGVSPSRLARWYRGGGSQREVSTARAVVQAEAIRSTMN